MRLLLDTHVWLWLAAKPDRLPAHVRRHAAKEANERILSAVSAWEIALKYSIGKLTLPQDPAHLVPRVLSLTKTCPLAIQHRHVLHVATLPHHHADPFDRLLIAQAQIEDLTIVTADRQFASYDVKVIWAD